MLSRAQCFRHKGMILSNIDGPEWQLRNIDHFSALWDVQKSKFFPPTSRVVRYYLVLQVYHHAGVATIYAPYRE
jgi:hypothetical protein